jgi:hypothetical protein
MRLWRDNVQSGFQLVLALLNDTRVTVRFVSSHHGMERRDERGSSQTRSVNNSTYKGLIADVTCTMTPRSRK